MITPDNSESDVMINVEEHNSNYMGAQSDLHVRGS